MLICDSESSGFKWEADKIWVICAYDIDKQRFSFSFDDTVNLNSVYKLLNKRFGFDNFDVWITHMHHLREMGKQSICFHNYFQHDKPLIKKFYPWFNPKEEHDSYILSQLFNPDRGQHGLDAWSKRVGREGKVAHEDWSKFSPEMLHRVIEDVKDNVAAWEVLMKEKAEWESQGGSWDEAIKIEYGIADLQGRQEMHGVMLDQDKAYALADEIYTEIQKIDETLLEQMPLRVIQGAEVSKPFRKDGQLTKVVERWFE
jgi:hypothetical protein